MRTPTGWIFAALLLGSSLVAAQTWPVRPIRVVIPVAAGSGPDNVMRILGERVSSELGQPVIIDPKPGAGGLAAAQSFRSARDDHSFLFVITSTAIAPLTLKAAGSFDLFKEAQPIVQIAESPLMIVANPKSGAKTLADMVRMAKESPGKVAVATPVPRSLGNLSAELLVQSAGIQLNIIPFTKLSDSMAAVLGGEVPFAIDAISATLPLVRDNRLQPIAILSGSRLPGLEAYATGQETLNGYQVLGIYGLVGQKELSGAAAEKMIKAFGNALADPAVAQRMKLLGLFPKFEAGGDYQKTLQNEMAVWRKVIQGAGLQPE